MKVVFGFSVWVKPKYFGFGIWGKIQIQDSTGLNQEKKGIEKR